MSRYAANVRRATGHTVHHFATADGEQLAPEAVRVVLEPSEHGVVLLRFAASGDFAGDTWHQTLDEAKRQAHFEYAIEDADWHPVA